MFYRNKSSNVTSYHCGGKRTYQKELCNGLSKVVIIPIVATNEKDGVKITLKNIPHKIKIQRLVHLSKWKPGSFFHACLNIRLNTSI